MLSPDDELLRPREVAEILGVTTIMITRWARAGLLSPHLRTAGGHRRYRRRDVQVFRARYLDAVRLHGQGWSVRQVATRFDRTERQMDQILKNLRRPPS